MLTEAVNARSLIAHRKDFFLTTPNEFVGAVIEKNALSISIRHNQQYSRRHLDMQVGAVTGKA